MMMRSSAHGRWWAARPLLFSSELATVRRYLGIATLHVRNASSFGVCIKWTSLRVSHSEAMESLPISWKVVEEAVKITHVDDVATATAGSSPISRK